MSTTDIVSVCRFCGGEANEEPSRFDPAPNTCKDCMSERLAALILQAAASTDIMDSASARAWLERHLVDDVGFTPEFAARFAAGDKAWVEQKFYEYVLDRGVDAP